MAIERGRSTSSRHSTLSHHPHHPHPYPHQPSPYPPDRGSNHYPYQKPLGDKIKDCCRFTIAFIFSNVGVCGLMVGYTLMGAFLFSYIEFIPVSKREEINVDEARNRTIESIWNITMQHNVLKYPVWNANVSTIVCNYRTEILGFLDRGWDGNHSKPLNKWSRQGAFLYSLTVITTIGYGHIAPETEAGKVMTIVYTIFGMPVFLLYMANMGDILAKSLKWTYAKLCICKRPEAKFDTSVVWRSAEATLRAPGGPSHYHPDSEIGSEISMDTTSWSEGHAEKTDISSVNIPISVSLIIMALLLWGGMMMFEEYEDWDYLTSLYFCFISLTTIGFGDYVPGIKALAESDEDSNEELVEMRFIYCSVYLMSGLALLSMCFNLMQEEVVHKVTTCLNAIRVFKRREAD